MTEPKMKPVNYQNIPQEMKDIPHWVNWNYLQHNERFGKVPINPNTFRYAEANNPNTWGTFKKTCDNVRSNPRFGIGFEIGSKAAGAHSGLVCVDLDHVLKDGTIQNAAALEIFETLDSYTEISPGGDGLHIWIKADVTEERSKRKGPLEIYSDGRYITMTGDIYGNRPTIEERTAAINEMIDKYLTAAEPQQPKPAAPSSVGTSFPDTWTAAGTPVTAWTGQPDPDDIIIQKMTADPAAARLWAGDMSAYPRGNGTFDHSAADQALINILAYWANYDAATVDRLFRRSRLMRPKWDDIHDPARNRTYGQMTIDNALAGKSPRTAAQNPGSSSVGTSQQLSATQPLQNQAGLAAAQAQQAQAEDVYLYAATQWRAEFDNMILVKTPRISTGFPYLNMLLDGGLYPSLITLGAVTGEGKTTLALQIMDNIAAAGTDVIIFSLEMSRFELIAKSISRLGFKTAADKADAFTTRQLLNYDDYGKYSDGRKRLIEQSKQEYFDTIAPHVFIRESLGDMDVTKIKNALEAHRQQTGAAPVVLVDYIQLLTPPPTRKAFDRRQDTDLNIMTLKQLSRDYSIPVIAISSLNRQAYSTRGKQNQGQQNQDNRVTLADSKESGAIEYSSDILLGLNREDYDPQTKVGKMALDILKNRNGEKGTSQAFDYYYRFNYFDDVNRPTNAKAN